MFENGPISLLKWAFVIVIAFYLLKRIFKILKEFLVVLATIPKIPFFLNLKRGRFEYGLEQVFAVKVGKNPINDEEFSEEERKMFNEFPDDYDWDWKITESWDEKRIPTESIVVSFFSLFLWLACLIINLITKNKIFKVDFFINNIKDLAFLAISISSVVFIKYLVRQIPWASYRKYKLKKKVIINDYSYDEDRGYNVATETEKIVDAKPGDKGAFGSAEPSCPLDILWLLLGLFYLITPVLHYYILFKGPVMQNQVSWWEQICTIEKVGTFLIMLTVPLTLVILFIQKRRIKQSGYNSVFVLNTFGNVVKYIIGSVLIVSILMALTVFFIKVLGF